MMRHARLYPYLFALVVAFYCLVLARFGFENWDSGFINGFSWRLLQGEMPYRDFIYIRPPFSIYLHAILLRVLPETGQIYCIRIAGYLSFALISWCVVSGFDKVYRLRQLQLDKWAVMTLCFMASVHNFFADPWFTVDGILFASVAFYLVCRSRNLSLAQLFAVSLCCVLSALVKQSFYPIPIGFGLWILLKEGFRKAAFFGFFSAMLLGIFVAWLLSFTSWSLFLGQVAGVANAGNLYDTGFMNYLHIYHNKIIFGMVMALPLLISWFMCRKRPTLQDYLKWLAMVIFISAFLAVPFIRFKDVPVIFFNAVAAGLLYRIVKEKTLKPFLPVIALMMIGWCASLSLGYKTPVLFSGGLIVSYLWLMHEDFAALGLRRYYTSAGLAVCAFMLLLNIHPYRSQPITTLDCGMEAVSPKLAFIRSDKATLEKHLELKKLAQRFGPGYFTAPSLPLSHYLFGTQNPMPAGWLTNFEINGKVSGLLEAASRKKAYMFLEKSFLDGEPFIASDQNRKDFSQFAWVIYHKCRPIMQTRHFLVYQTDEIRKTL
ncbi:hypothetical protein [Flavobacterium magnum]|nr:hypothetical protein [Flavobacterium magnum]